MEDRKEKGDYWKAEKEKYRMIYKRYANRWEKVITEF
jgi:hypothetical protein